MPDVKFQSDSAGSVRVPWHQPAPVATGSGNGCFAQLVAGPQAGQGVQAAPAQVLFSSENPESPAGQTVATGDSGQQGLWGLCTVSTVPLGRAALGAIPSAQMPDDMRRDSALPEDDSPTNAASGLDQTVAQTSVAPVQDVPFWAELSPFSEQMAEAAVLPQAVPEGFGQFAGGPAGLTHMAQLPTRMACAQMVGTILRTGGGAAPTGQSLASPTLGQPVAAGLVVAGRGNWHGAKDAVNPAAQTGLPVVPIAEAALAPNPRLSGRGAAAILSRSGPAAPPQPTIPSTIVALAPSGPIGHDLGPRLTATEFGDGFSSMMMSVGAGPSGSALAPIGTALAASPATPSQQVALALASAQGDTLELVLSPEELGRVRIQLQSSETGLHLLISTERPETLDLLRRNIAHLSRDLSGLGLGNTSFEFAGDQPKGGQDQGRRADAGQTEFRQVATSDLPIGQIVASGQILSSDLPGAGLDLRF